MSGDQHELGRLASQDTLERWSELLESIVDCWNNHGNILVGEFRFAWNRFRFICPMANAVHEEAEVSMDPGVCVRLCL